MRLPYLQVAMEVMEQSAPDVAVVLGVDEAKVGWGLLKLFRWALGRCPDDKPPSASDVVKGPAAAKLIAVAARFDGDPDAFVDALASTSPDPLLERRPDGIRVCGLNRYDAAWLKNQPKDVAARWRATLSAETPAESAPEPARNRAGKVAEPAPQIQTQTQIHTKATTPPVRADASDTLRDKVDRVWEQKRGRKPARGAYSDADLRALWDKAEGDEAELLRVVAAALERSGYPAVGKFTDIAKFYDTYAATKGPEPARRASPYARATDADKVSSGYDPPTTADGDLDLAAVLG